MTLNFEDSLVNFIAGSMKKMKIDINKPMSLIKGSIAMEMESNNK